MSSPRPCLCAHIRPCACQQEYLVARAARHAVPAVNNTNVDRSVATIHATVLGCLRRQARVRACPGRPCPRPAPQQHDARETLGERHGSSLGFRGSALRSAPR